MTINSLVPLGNRLVLFGGCDDVTGSYDTVLRCFNLQQRRWSGLAVGGIHPRARAPATRRFRAKAANELNDTFLLRVWP
ncbi:hypothetical protein T492DRAFT_861216 [Pavlovales sp. CCMP2436]|nr:hypothetical protein T492DRAFT_861216 [Pavlovales sp. CCMP2436]